MCLQCQWLTCGEGWHRGCLKEWLAGSEHTCTRLAAGLAPLALPGLSAEVHAGLAFRDAAVS